jgi:hypothetical protein
MDNETHIYEITRTPPGDRTFILLTRDRYTVLNLADVQNLADELSMMNLD